MYWNNLPFEVGSILSLLQEVRKGNGRPKPQFWLRPNVVARVTQLSEQESEYLNHHLHSAVKTKFVTIILYDSCL